MNTKRLKPIREVAASREDQALEVFLQRQRELQAAEARLAELTAYLESYQQPTRKTVTPAMLINGQAFVERLRQAVQFQHNQVAQASKACELERARWLLTSRDTRMLDQLAKCYVEREQRAADRSAQRELDDRVCAVPGAFSL